MKNLAVFVLLSLATFTFARAAVTVTPLSSGLQIVGDSETLKFVLGYPVLSTADKKKNYGNKGVEVKDNTAVLKYEGGGTLTITVDPATGTITMQGDNLPTDVASLSMRMPISLSFNVGGTYQGGDKPAKPFPETKPDKPHIYQGNDTTMTIRAGDGKGIKITTPLAGYQEVTDMREWNTQSFGYMTLSTYKLDAPLTFKVEDAGPAPAAADAGATPAPANP